MYELSFFDLNVCSMCSMTSMFPLRKQVKGEGTPGYHMTCPTTVLGLK